VRDEIRERLKRFIVEHGTFSRAAVG
jgi:hypothetical protein